MSFKQLTFLFAPNERQASERTSNKPTNVHYNFEASTLNKQQYICALLKATSGVTHLIQRQLQPASQRVSIQKRSQPTKQIDKLAQKVSTQRWGGILQARIYSARAHILFIIIGLRLVAYSGEQLTRLDPVVVSEADCYCTCLPLHQAGC